MSLERREGEYIGYEYKEIYVSSSKSTMYIDGYRNFGWQVDFSTSRLSETGNATIKLKRNRKIINKAELTRLQRKFEVCMKQIDTLEVSKKTKATIISLAVGLLGTFFMAGATFAAVNEPPIVWLCVLLAIPGFAGWTLPCLLFRYFCQRRTEVVIPLIEEKYDEIYDVCEKGNKLLGEYNWNKYENDKL